MASAVNDIEMNYNFLYPVSQYYFHQLCAVPLPQHSETILNTKHILRCSEVESNM
jgi:hypothetical protein